MRICPKHLEVLGRGVVLELLVAEIGRTLQSGQPAIEAKACIFGCCSAQRSRAIEEVSGGSYQGGLDNREGAR